MASEIKKSTVKQGNKRKRLETNEINPNQDISNHHEIKQDNNNSNALSNKSAKPGKYENSSTDIWFKSSKANGYSFLSNFWPDVSTQAKQAVKDLVDKSNIKSNATNNTKELNKSEEGFMFNNKFYSSIEHFYHSMKYENNNLLDIAEAIRKQPTALAAKKYNTKIKKSFPINIAKWNEIDEKQMELGLRAKFIQNEILKQLLINTQNTILHEVRGRTKNNKWCDNNDGKSNKLGLLLMKVREHVQTST